MPVCLPGVKGLADGVHHKANLSQLCGIQQVASVEHERRLLHGGVHLLPVQGLELVPLRDDGDGRGALDRLVRAGAHRDLGEVGGSGRAHGERVVPLELVRGQVAAQLALTAHTRNAPSSQTQDLCPAPLEENPRP